MRYGTMMDLINCQSIYEGSAKPKGQTKRKMTFDEVLALR